MSRDKKEVPGYSNSKDMIEYHSYQHRLEEIGREIRVLNEERNKIETYNQIRKRLGEMGVWEEVITMIHDFQVLFNTPDDPIYDTLLLMKRVSFSIASVKERNAMRDRRVPVSSYAYSIDWPDDPIERLEGVFFIDRRLEEARRRFQSQYFKQRLKELESRAAETPEVPSKLERKVRIARPLSLIG